MIDQTKLIGHTAGIVAAYVSRNVLTATELPKVLAQVHAVLAQLQEPPAPAVVEADALRPAISIRKSVSPERLFCLECGKSFQSIKRHLKADHQLSPEEYRQRWDLPSDYPMVTANYSAKRSRLAMDSGLGRQPRVKAAARKRRGSLPAGQPNQAALVLG